MNYLTFVFSPCNKAPLALCLMNMKKLIIDSTILTCLALVTVFQSCRKPVEPKPGDPCDNKVLVTALDPQFYYWGHFALLDKTNVERWLYAVNWDDFSSKVKPGEQYLIAYEEVKFTLYCGDNTKNAGICGTQEAHPLKCIKILCLEPFSICREPVTCLPTSFDQDIYNSGFSEALEGIRIEDNSLKVKLGFSGCDGSQTGNFSLFLSELPTANATGSYIFLAKAINGKAWVCNAYFEKEVCFELTTLKTFLMTRNYARPKAIIRLQLRDGSSRDFEYAPF